jgi:hypothetical protein
VPVTVTAAVAELLVGLGSGTVEVTLTVFDNEPVWDGVTTIVIVALAAFDIVPKLHVTVVVPEQLPCDAIADTNVTPAGNTSVAVTFVALSGPLFVTVIV